ncbi:MAG: hypothetical protein SPI56_02000 [Alloprevotella sp.]|nr:hypothetical protein [Alloprevotella sp.]
MENKNSKSVEVPNISTTAEEVTQGIAVLLLVIGLIGAVVIFSTMGADSSGLNPYGCTLAIGVGISSILWWGLLRVICNISLRLEQLNEVMANQPKAVAEDNTVCPSSDSTDTAAPTKEEKRVKVNVGDVVVRLRDGKKYKVQEVSGDSILIDGGFFAGYIWLSPDQYKTIEE